MAWVHATWIGLLVFSALVSVGVILWYELVNAPLRNDWDEDELNDGSLDHTGFPPWSDM